MSKKNKKNINKTEVNANEEIKNVEADVIDANEKPQKNPSVIDKRKIKYGAFSVSSIIVMIIIAVLAVKLVELPKWSFDFSTQGIYTVPEECLEIAKNVENDTVVYVIQSEDQFDTTYKNMLEKFAGENKHISIEYKPLDVYPTFGNAYSNGEEVKENSIIVVTGDKYRFVSSDNYLVSGYTTSNTEQVTIEFASLLASAVDYTNDAETPVVYNLTGHGEVSIPSTMQNLINKNNYEVSDLQLLTSGGIPEDAKLVMIVGANADYSKEELAMISEYVENGGNLYVILDPLSDYLPNLYGMMNDYGVNVCEGVVIEKKSDMYILDTPYYLLPQMEDTALTNPISDKNKVILTTTSKGMQATETGDYSVTSLLSTSEYAFSIVDPQGDITVQTEDDIDGPFSLGYMCEADDKGKVVILGTTYLMDDNVNEYVGGANRDFVINCINYLAGQEDKVTISGITVSMDYALYSVKQQIILSAIAVINIPMVVIIIGIILCIVRICRRKYKNSNSDCDVDDDGDDEELDVEAKDEDDSTEVGDEEVSEDTEEDDAAENNATDDDTTDDEEK